MHFNERIEQFRAVCLISPQIFWNINVFYMLILLLLSLLKYRVLWNLFMILFVFKWIILCGLRVLAHLMAMRKWRCNKWLSTNNKHKANNNNENNTSLWRIWHFNWFSYLFAEIRFFGHMLSLLFICSRAVWYTLRESSLLCQRQQQQQQQTGKSFSAFSLAKF